MVLVRLNKKTIEQMNIFGYENVYILKNQNKILGIGMYKNELDINMIYLMIYEQYRGNGYGTILLKNILSMLKDKAYKEIILEFENSNQKCINLISKFGAVQLSTKDNLVRYLLPIR